MLRLLGPLAVLGVILSLGNALAGEEQLAAAGFPATLTEPTSQPENAPLVLFFSGSGPTDRDGNSRLGVSAGYMAKLADGLAAQGIGSLRFDKRGVPGSVSVAREEDVTLATYAEDGVAVLDWLQSTSGKRPVILLGHSEGGLVALEVARMRPDILGVVLLATPGLPPADTLREQLRVLEEPLRAEALAITGQIEAGETVEDVPQPLLPIFRPSVQPFLQSLFARRPADELASLAMPVLAIGGGSDLQVRKADFDALAGARPDVKSVWAEAMNHVLVDASEERAANLRTYSDPALPLSEGLVDSVAAFVDQVSGRQR